MANIMDYLAWRGDLPVAADGWNEVDALVLANFCYNDLSGDVAGGGRMTLRNLAPRLPLKDREGGPFFTKWKDLLYQMAETRRFGDMVLSDYEDAYDSERSMQFSAVTADFGGQGCFVCFRGTDGTVAGWREDFNMAFETPVPAQAAALAYLERVAARFSGELRICGHSKGGNLAMYAAIHAAPEIQARIRAVYSFDGPGLDDASMDSDGYRRIRPVLHSYIPQASVVGLLLSYHPEYVIVKSKSLSLLQHDAFNWQLLGTRFEAEEEIRPGSRLMDETLHEWMKSCTPEQRRLLVNTAFDILQSTNAVEFTDLRKDLRGSASAMLGAMRNVDARTALMIGRLLARLAKIGAGNLKDMIAERHDKALPGGSE